MADRCAWCLGKKLLIGHHYPIPKREGGTEIVHICPDCHGKAHAGIIVNATGAKTEQEILDTITQAIHLAAATDFPGLARRGPYKVPYDRVITLNPYWKMRRK